MLFHVVEEEDEGCGEREEELRVDPDQAQRSRFDQDAGFYWVLNIYMTGVKLFVSHWEVVEIATMCTSKLFFLSILFQVYYFF